MPTTPTCPDADRLRQFVLGWIGGPEAVQLEQHVAACPRCLEGLGSLPTDDPLERALRGPDDPTALPLDDLAAAAIPRLKRLQPSAETGTYDAGEAPTPVPPPGDSWDFLDPPQAADEVGRLGPYRILRLLGSGGMGMVFVAEDPRLKRRLALKVIHAALVTRADVHQRFLREAQAIAALEHENIVAIYEVNEHRGVPYLAMPLLRGESLEDRLKRTAGPLPADEVLRIGREVAEGLAAAHARGLVHRDVKPGNIFLEGVREEEVRGQRSEVSKERAASSLTPDPWPLTPLRPPRRVKLLDFGLARPSGGADAHRGAGPAGGSPQLTRDGAITGTPAYMAPEQAQGQPVDGRADLFSLGCVLYRMATGRSAFQGGSAIDVLLKVLQENPPAPQALNPELPPALAGLIVQLLAKRREDRPESAGAVAEALRAVERERADAGRPKPSRRRRLAAAAGGVLAAAALTAGLLHFLQPGPVPEEPGEVTFDYAEPDQRLALRRGADEEQVVDLAEARTRVLPPGDYSLRPVAAAERRRLDPERVLLRPGEKRTLWLRLVGEVRQHKAHHPHPVNGVAAVGRAGPLILAVGEDRYLSVWDAVRGGKPEVYRHAESPWRCLAVSPDGRHLAAGSGDVGPRARQLLRLWDVAALERPRIERERPSQITALAFSPDGRRLLSAENDGTLVLWDAATGAVQWELPRAHGGLGTFALAWLPGGQQVLTGGGDGQVVLRELFQEKPVGVLRGHADRVAGAALLAGGRQAVSAGFDATLRVWDLETARPVRTTTTPAALRALAVSPDGRRWLTGGGDGAVRLWDSDTGRELVRFDGHVGGVTAVAFLPDGRRAVSGGSDGTVRLWELPN